MSAAISLTPSALDLAPGLHLNVPEDLYHRKVLGMASSTALHRLAQSPAHYYAWATSDEHEETDALRLGRAVHCAMLEPSRYDREYIAEPDWGPCRANADAGVSKEQGKANKERRDAWRAAHAGAPLLTADEARTIRGMVASVLAKPKLRRLLEAGAEANEATVRWRDPSTGIECKARLDSYAEEFSVAIDLKSTTDSSADGFDLAVSKYGYYRQAALYRDGMAAIGRPLRPTEDGFVFLAVEKSPPYEATLNKIDDDGTGLALRHVHRLLRNLAVCLERGEWPGYEDTIHKVTLKPWVKE